MKNAFSSPHSVFNLVLVLVFVVYNRRRESQIKYPGPDDDIRLVRIMSRQCYPNTRDFYLWEHLFNQLLPSLPPHSHQPLCLSSHACIMVPHLPSYLIAHIQFSYHQVHALTIKDVVTFQRKHNKLRGRGRRRGRHDRL